MNFYKTWIREEGKIQKNKKNKMRKIFFTSSHGGHHQLYYHEERHCEKLFQLFVSTMTVRLFVCVFYLK